ncbi:MAG TPA: hypothetical protein VFO01_11475 [Trebonia sp.]|nr:hypothetical protein [Trebonia sp.]
MASRRRKRQAEIHASLVTRGLTDQTFAEFREHARPTHGDDPQNYTDFGEVPGDFEHKQGRDDERGIVAGGSYIDPGQERDSAFAGQMALQEAIDAVNTEYDRRARPYRATMKRNPGVVLPELAALMRDRDARIADLTRAQQRAQALDQAARNAPQRAVQAHERQQEQAALTALARDLPGGSRHCAPPQWTGRPTGDIAIW